MKKRVFTNADDLLKDLVKHRDQLGKHIEGLYSPRDEIDVAFLNDMFLINFMKSLKTWRGQQKGA